MQPEQALVETEVSTFAAAVALAVLHQLVQSARHTSHTAIGPKRISYNVTCSQNITCCLRLLGSHLAHAQLFPRGALEFYTAKNMGWHVTEAQVRRLRVSCRGLRVRVRC